MTMDENENNQVSNEKPGLEKNLTVPILVVAMLTALAVWLVPDDEENIDLSKPLPQLDSVIQPLEEGDSALPSLDETSALPPLDTGSAIRPLDEIETDVGDNVTKSVGESEDEDTAKSDDQQVDSKPDKSDDDDVRTLISQLRKEGSGSGQKAFEYAEKKRRVGDNENAYLLYFFAARQGHGDAALVLGTMADPMYYTTVTSALTAPEPAQAIKWYKKAIDAGNKDAKKNLADLTRRIKKQAEGGSSEAQRLLLLLR
jgi:hypothetical protein